MTVKVWAFEHGVVREKSAASPLISVVSQTLISVNLQKYKK